MTTIKKIQKKTPVYCDSSAVIVLHELQVLDSFLKFAELSTVQEVVGELAPLTVPGLKIVPVQPLSTADTSSPPPKTLNKSQPPRIKTKNDASKTPGFSGTGPSGMSAQETAFILHPLKGTDLVLVTAALHSHAVVCAEDRRILRVAEELDLPVVDSLTVCLILMLQNHISQSVYQRARSTLATRYRYSPQLLRRADDIAFYHQKMA